MEKLVKLLIEKDGYDDVEYKIQSDGGYMFWCDGMAYREERICSKKFGFIERLVKNDKIDDKVYSDFEEKVVHDTDSMPNTIYGLDWNIAVIYMLLSIQDNPLEYLVSILK